MAWYNDALKTVHVSSYKNERELERELKSAAFYGWSVKSTTGLSGHINVGRTVTGMALTGGLSLLFGASRTEGKIIVTWERDQSTAKFYQMTQVYNQAREQSFPALAVLPEPQSRSR